MTETAPTIDTLALDINQAHAAAQAAAHSAIEHAKRCGELLIQAKAAVPHGAWLPWLQANTTVSERTAQGYMRLATHWDALQAKAQRVADLPLRDALALIAEPTPSPSLAAGPRLNDLAEAKIRVERALGMLLNGLEGQGRPSIAPTLDVRLAIIARGMARAVAELGFLDVADLIETSARIFDGFVARGRWIPAAAYAGYAAEIHRLLDRLPYLMGLPAERVDEVLHDEEVRRGTLRGIAALSDAEMDRIFDEECPAIPCSECGRLGWACPSHAQALDRAACRVLAAVQGNEATA